jgi:hypothetical protein
MAKFLVHKDKSGVKIKTFCRSTSDAVHGKMSFLVPGPLPNRQFNQLGPKVVYTKLNAFG